MKIKQIRKPIIYQFKTNNRINSILNTYSYKNIVFLKLMQKHYNQVKKFDILKELDNKNYLYYLYYLKEFHQKDKFILKLYKDTLTFLNHYISNPNARMELNYIYLLSFLNIVENIPIKKVISEWNYKNKMDLEKEYLKIDNIKDLKNLLKFKCDIPLSKNIPIFEKDGCDIQLDTTIIEITLRNTINYVPSVKKILSLKHNHIKGIIINPRFELYKEIDLNNFQN